MTKDKFRTFDRAKPLLSLHVPKCAGSGLWQALQDAGRPSFRMLAYYPDIGYLLPTDWNAPDTIIHGHFIRRNEQAVETVCKGADQCITVLRNPFQVVVSAYFYGKKEGLSWATSNSLEWFLEWWLQQELGPLMSALPTIKGHQSTEDYVASFVQIGVVSRMSSFYAALERILDVKFPNEKVINASLHSEDVPDLENSFRKKFPFDFELYEYSERLAMV